MTMGKAEVSFKAGAELAMTGKPRSPSGGGDPCG
jgi:hypothetical protein